MNRVNRKFNWILGFVGFIISLFIITAPDEVDYNEWLSSKQGIICDHSGLESGCKMGDRAINRDTREIKNARIYLQVRETFSQSNKEYDIKAVGVLNHFFDMSSFTIYD
ncbi:hypothetical protein J45TS6_14440 [Paenibacillus sp. J45TS6]|uniref:hypothetical protein n=1 Tax=Paenibacillus sp. J45TS6 TaxID=2807196 RepID=UPI001B1C5BCE|nr:hypothetical protein [Paenibacillus sp. J45TS6]GIP42985.1 hypothetical protein J45TS6_14440 [Paenibacillus sp. J45TS6]